MTRPGENWSSEEVSIIIEDYFAMLRQELAGVLYVKATHIRSLLTRLPSRSKKSIEFKHRNISAVLDGAGYPYIPGYKPLAHFQRDLGVAVRAHIQNTDFFGEDRPLSAEEADLIDHVHDKSPDQPAVMVKVDGLIAGRDIEKVIASIRLRNIGKTPDEIEAKVTKIRRSYELVTAMKAKFGNRCQIISCRFTFAKRSGGFYSEAAHIKPISGRTIGLDVPENILILCPNHHKMLDLGKMNVLSNNTAEIDGKVHELFMV